MENKLDNLFRNKLTNLEEKPTPQAWEQIYSKLSSIIKILWLKRLSIAASILLIATAVIFGYRSLIEINIDQKQETVSSESRSKATKTEESRSTSVKTLDDSVSGENREVEGNENLVAINNSSDPKDQTIRNAKSDIAESAEIVTSKDESRLTEANLDEEEFIIVPTTSYDQTVSEEEITSENGNDKRSTSESDGKITNDKKDNDGEIKTYPKIKIIYKANQNSRLVVSNKKTILDKGINKIAEFSDEHLLTAERKTKLRNTKNDLLALNFGKLLNKSDTELEN